MKRHGVFVRIVISKIKDAESFQTIKNNIIVFFKKFKNRVTLIHENCFPTP